MPYITLSDVFKLNRSLATIDSTTNTHVQNGRNLQWTVIEALKEKVEPKIKAQALFWDVAITKLFQSHFLTTTFLYQATCISEGILQILGK